MAEAISRLVTGRRVHARLYLPDTLRQASPESTFAATALMPEPISNRRWRNNHLIDPQEQAGRIGTAKRLSNKDSLETYVELPDGYRMLFKTGTLSQRTGWESEMLLFVVGAWDQSKQEFVAGRTRAGFLFMEDPRKSGENPEKFRLAKNVLDTVINHLR